MIISNVRLGFACNSSSTHSVLFLEPGEGKPVTDEDTDFGWEFFTVADDEAKLKYLRTLVDQHLAWSLGDEIGRVVADDLFDGRGHNPDGYVDHQSVFGFPYDRNDRPNLPFLRDLVSFFLRDDVVILGGNDNTDVEHPLAADGRTWIPYDGALSGSGSVAVKDDLNDEWVLFNKTTGTKVRMRLSDGRPDNPKGERSSFPELADVKITDYCNFGCGYCLEGSTKDGRHADLHTVRKVLAGLAQAGCFEVALGGGEPTQHPEFGRIVESGVEAGLCVNVTTRNPLWFKKNPGSGVSAVAVSVDTVDAAVKALALVDDGVFRPTPARYVNPDVDGPVLSLQVIDGTLLRDELVEILEAAHEKRVRVTILGYKTKGRGDEWAGLRVGTDWLGVVEAFGVFRELGRGRDAATSFDPRLLAVDTALAAEYEAEMTERGVDPRSFRVDEGTHAFWVDAVENVYAASSWVPDRHAFCERDLGWELEEHGEWALEAFRSVTPHTRGQGHATV